MEFDPEKLERRRQKREALQQQRMQQQAKLKKQLILAGSIAGAVILVAVILLVVLITGAVSNSDATDPSELTTLPQTSATEPTEDMSNKTVIHFVAAGDFNVTDKVVASGGAALDYSRMIQDVMPLFAQADLSTMNFEGNFVGAPYGSQTVSAPTQVLTALSAAGVDMLQIANSRTISNGLTGLSSTINTIRANGIEPLGAYATESDYEESGGYTMWQVQGVRVAVVAYTKGMDNMALPRGSEDCVNLLYKDYSSKYVDVDTDGILDILERVEKEKPDVTVVLLHWGSEFNDTHSASQEKIRKLLLENGVDAIIGTHPHYVQQISYDSEKGTVVAYSLGDFVGDAARDGTQYSIILDLEITKDNSSGKAKITGCTHTPIFTYEDEEGMLQVLRIESAMYAYEADYLDCVSDEVYEAMKNAKDRIADRVK